MKSKTLTLAVVVLFSLMVIAATPAQDTADDSGIAIPIALALAGVVTPFLTQVIRKVTGEFGASRVFAQLLTFGVSLVLGAIALAAVGDLSYNGDLIAAMSIVYAVASVVYKQLQSSVFDNMLDYKNGS